MPGIGETTGSAGSGRARLDWADLQLFHAIAETGSFTSAARVLGLTQPTVSQRAKELEDRVGAQLFVRTTSGVALTEAGMEIRTDVQAMSRVASKIGNLIADKDRRDAGRVRLRTTDGIATFWLAPRLVQLQRQFPDIHVTLDADLWRQDPVTTEVEVSLTYDNNKHPDNVVIPIGTAHYLAYAARSYLETHGKPETLADLAQHRAIRHAGQGGQGRQEEAWSPKQAALWELWGNEIETNCSPAVLFAAQAGAGVALLPSTATLFAPDLVPVGPAPIVSLTKWLVYHRDVANVGRVKRVVQWLKDCYDPQYNPWFREDFVHPSDFSEDAIDRATITRPLQVAKAAARLP